MSPGPEGLEGGAPLQGVPKDIGGMEGGCPQGRAGLKGDCPTAGCPQAHGGAVPPQGVPKDMSGWRGNVPPQGGTRALRGLEGGCAQGWGRGWRGVAPRPGGLEGGCPCAGCPHAHGGAAEGLSPRPGGLEWGYPSTGSPQGPGRTGGGLCPRPEGLGGVPKAKGDRMVTVPPDGAGSCTAPSTARPSAPTTGGATSAARATTRAGTPVSVSGASGRGALGLHPTAGCPLSSPRTLCAWPCPPSSLQPGVRPRPLRRSRAVPV